MTTVKTKKGKIIVVPAGMKWDEEKQCLVRPTLKEYQVKRIYKNHLRARLEQSGS